MLQFSSIILKNPIQIQHLKALLRYIKCIMGNVSRHSNSNWSKLHPDGDLVFTPYLFLGKFFDFPKSCNLYMNIISYTLLDFSGQNKFCLGNEVKMFSRNGLWI